MRELNPYKPPGIVPAKCGKLRKAGQKFPGREARSGGVSLRKDLSRNPSIPLSDDYSFMPARFARVIVGSVMKVADQTSTRSPYRFNRIAV